MKDLEDLINEYKQEVDFIRDRKENLIKRGFVKHGKYHSGRENQLRSVISDLEELSKKLNRAPNRSSKVIENDRTTNTCLNCAVSYSRKNTECANCHPTEFSNWRGK